MHPKKENALLLTNEEKSVLSGLVQVRAFRAVRASRLSIREARTGQLFLVPGNASFLNDGCQKMKKMRSPIFIFVYLTQFLSCLFVHQRFYVRLIDSLSHSIHHTHTHAHTISFAAFIGIKYWAKNQHSSKAHNRRPSSNPAYLETLCQSLEGALAIPRYSFLGQRYASRR